MEWSKFQDRFHPSWRNKMKPFIESKECDEIYAFLKTQSGKGVKIAPQSINTFRCFKETSLDDLKCVLVFQDPYFTFKDGEPVADGLALGCSITERAQPTLKQFYDGIEKELYDGLNLDYIDSYDVSYLAKQGVLMFNAALTVEKDKAGSHKDVWLPFTKYVLEQIIGFTGVPIIFFGKQAQEYECLVEQSNLTLSVSHPASASYNGGVWDSKKVFSLVNEELEKQDKDGIMWLNIDTPF